MMGRNERQCFREQAWVNSVGEQPGCTGACTGGGRGGRRSGWNHEHALVFVGLIRECLYCDEGQEKEQWCLSEHLLKLGLQAW